MMSDFADDLRWAGRLARRRPVFALTMIATLAVTMAATTTAFGVANAVLWKPLPFTRADDLVLAWEQADLGQGPAASRVTSGRYADWREHSRVFSSMAAFAATGATLEGADGATAIRGVRVTAAYFDTLGIAPLVGRTFTAQDEIPGNDRVVVLSHAMWQQRFGGSASAIGAELRLNGNAYTIVGVMPPVVFPGWPVNPGVVTLLPEHREYWVPIAHTPQFDAQSRSHLYGVVARLAPGVSRPAAEAALSALATPASPDPHPAHVTPLRAQFVDAARLPLLTLLGAALAVLLIACANLAALQVTVIESRRSEMIVRAAIGAGTWRLARQLLTESLALALSGGAAGLLLSRAALGVAPGLLPQSVPLLTNPELDLRVAAFGAASALMCGLVVAAWPIVRVLGGAPAPRGVAARPRSGVYRGLVVAQMAVTVALVTSAGLLAQSLRTVRSQDAGFAVDDVLVADVGLPSTRFSNVRSVISFEDRALDVLGGLAAVRGVALAYDNPLESNWSNAYTMVGGPVSARQEGSGSAELRIVSPSYFRTLGVELVDGRLPERTDDVDAPGVVVVNQAFAETVGFAPVVGRRLRSSSARGTWGALAPDEFEIVGIVENERFRGLEQPSLPAIYMTTRQFPQTDMSVIVRTKGDPAPLAGPVRDAVRRLDAGVTCSAPVALSRILADQLATRRVTTDLVSGFAGVALALAALGLHGLLIVVVAGQTREIGVRLALGASPSVVARHVVGDSVRNAAIGVGAGLVLAIVSGRLLQSLLVGVTPRDPLTLSAVALTLLAVAGGASFIPARRAATVDPATTLRAD